MKGMDRRTYLQSVTKTARDRAILARRKQGVTTRALAAEFGVSQAVILRALKRAAARNGQSVT